MPRELSAGGVVVRRMRGRWWVAAIRPRREGHREVWALPKGHLEPGERPAETALREAYEETGLRTRLGEKLGDVKYAYTRTAALGGSGERIFKIVSFYLLHASGGRIGEIPPGMEIEVAEARWLRLEDAPRLLAYGGEKEMARRAADVLD